MNFYQLDYSSTIISATVRRSRALQTRVVERNRHSSNCGQNSVSSLTSPAGAWPHRSFLYAAVIDEHWRTETMMAWRTGLAETKTQNSTLVRLLGRHPETSFLGLFTIGVLYHHVTSSATWRSNFQPSYKGTSHLSCFPWLDSLGLTARSCWWCWACVPSSDV